MSAIGLPAHDLLIGLNPPDGVHVVDVGARWGSAGAWWRLHNYATVHSFEPDAAECERLDRLHPGTRHHPYALGGSECTETLHVTSEPGGSSLLKLIPGTDPRISSLPLLRDYQVVAELPVPVMRFRHWVTQHSGWPIERDPDFFKIDVQGYEMHVLRGIGPARTRMLAVEVEVLFAPMYEGQCYFSDVDRFLRGCGMSLWRLTPQVHYSRQKHPKPGCERALQQGVYNNVCQGYHSHAGRLFWSNAFYFRDPLTIPAFDRTRLLKLAAFHEAAGDFDGAVGALERALVGEMSEVGAELTLRIREAIDELNRHY